MATAGSEQPPCLLHLGGRGRIGQAVDLLEPVAEHNVVQRLRQHPAALCRPAGKERLDERLESGHCEPERAFTGDGGRRAHDDVTHMMHEHGEPTGRRRSSRHRRCAGHPQRHGDRGPGHRAHVEPGENPANHVGILSRKAVELLPHTPAIVLRHQRQCRVPALEIGIPGGAVPLDEPAVEHGGEPRAAAAGVVEPLHEVAQRRLEGRQFDGREILPAFGLAAGQAHPSRRPRHPLASHAVDPADREIEPRPPRLQPLPDLVPDNLPRRGGQIHANACLAFEHLPGLLPLPSACLKGVEPRPGPGLRIEHDAEGTLHGLELDAIEVALGEPGPKIDCAAVGRELGQRVKLNMARLRRTEVVRHGIHCQRFDARLGSKRRQPAADAIALPWPVDHVEDNDHGLAGGSRCGEEVSHGSVVVFLLREHRHDHVACVAHQFGAVPVVPQRAIDVGRVEEHESGGLPAARILAPHQPIGIAPFIRTQADRVLDTRPRHRSEARKQRRQINLFGEPAGQAGHRVPRPGRLRDGAADLSPHERVGDQALAGVCAATDRRHEKRFPRYLWPELAKQRAVPVVILRVGGAERAGQRLQKVDQSAQFCNAAGPRRKPRRRH